MSITECIGCESKFNEKQYYTYSCPRVFDFWNRCPICSHCDCKLDDCLRARLGRCWCGFVYDFKNCECPACDNVINQTEKNPIFILDIERYTTVFQSDDYQGFRIHTTVGDIIAAIDSRQQCCETWGIEMTDFSLEPGGCKYFESKIDEIDLSIDDKAKSIIPSYHDVDNKLTLSIYTNAGRFIVFMWNDHNGYYPHNYYINKFGKVNAGTL